MSSFEDILVEVIKSKNKPDKWKNSKYQDYYNLTNTQKGDSVEKTIETFLLNNNFDVVEKTIRIGDDTTVNGIKGENCCSFIKPIIIEDKGASEDITGKFQFNHVRKDKKYNFLLLIGISPNEINFQLYSKEEVLSGFAGTLTPMGKDQGGIGNEGTFKITKSKNELLSIEKFLDILKLKMK